MPFDPDDPRLTAFALGELDAADRRAIEAILRDDPEARAFVLGVEETARLLSEEFGLEATAADGLDPARRGAIEHRLASDAPATIPIAAAAPRPPRLRLLLPLAAVAGLAGLAVAVTLPSYLAARRARVELALNEVPTAPPPPPAALVEGRPSEPAPEMAATLARTHGAEEEGIVRHAEASRPPTSTPALVASAPSAAAVAPGRSGAGDVGGGGSGGGMGVIGGGMSGPGGAAPVSGPRPPAAVALGRGLAGAEGGRAAGFGRALSADPSRSAGEAELLARTEVRRDRDRSSANRLPVVLGTQGPGTANVTTNLGIPPAEGGTTRNARPNAEPLLAQQIQPGQMPTGEQQAPMRRYAQSNRQDRANAQNAGQNPASNAMAQVPMTPGQQVAMLQAPMAPAPQGQPVAQSGAQGSPINGQPGAPTKPADALQASGGGTNVDLSSDVAYAKNFKDLSQARGSMAGMPDAGANPSQAPPQDQNAAAGAKPAQQNPGGAGNSPSPPENFALALPDPAAMPAPAEAQKQKAEGFFAKLHEVDQPAVAKRSATGAVLAPAPAIAPKGFVGSAEKPVAGQPNSSQPSQGQPQPARVVADQAQPPAKAPTQLAFADEAERGRLEQVRREFDAKQAELRQVVEQTQELRKRLAREQTRVDREAYARFYDHPFANVVGNELSTFAIDVDTGAYANVRRFLAQGQLPPPDAVRIEELLNYFRYDDPAPKGDEPFSVNCEVAACPWDGGHRLARIGLKCKSIDADKRPTSNLVFLIDVSGSMGDLNKLPLLKAGMKLLVERLTENDRVGIVTYSNEVKEAFPSTPCHRKAEILAAIDGLQAGGGTNGGAGIQTAYGMAEKFFIKGGSNRVILATDGDFNLGLSKEELLATSEARAKSGVFLTVLGFGQGNIQEDFMEQLADKGNGHYAYIDTIDEARKVLVREMSGTLVTVAKDVKVQVEFNPERVASYRLIGYENRVMEAQDFRDDRKDAGEIGAGHSVTALYEFAPAGAPAKFAGADRPLKYRRSKADVVADQGASPEAFTVYLRYKRPDGAAATELSRGVVDDGRDFGRASSDLRFASAVAGFGMLLRGSPYRGSITYPGVLEIASAALGDDPHGDRKGFLELIRQAMQIEGADPAP